MPINPLRGIRVPAAEHTPPYESFLESRGFRLEIQGLRAFAVLYHVWIGKVSGGVDVFLFISAFLLSLSFMRKINDLAVMTLKWKPRHVRTRVVMGWVGALGLVTCGAVLPVERTFPGYLAL